MQNEFLKRFALLTVHRPSKVDDRSVLKSIVDFLTNDLVKELPLFWIIHPRTENKLKSFGLWDKVLNSDKLFILGPLGYHDLLRLNMAASIMLTDSGGVLCFGNTLFDAVEQAMKFLISNISVAFEFDGSLQRRERFSYPLPALCEALLNAVVHRDYANSSDIQIKIFDDRITIF